MTSLSRCVATLAGVFSLGVARAASFDPVSKLTFGSGPLFDTAEWFETLVLIGISTLIYALLILLLGRCFGFEEPGQDD